MAVSQALSSVIWIEVGNIQYEHTRCRAHNARRRIKHNKKYYEKVLPPPRWEALRIVIERKLASVNEMRRTSHIWIGYMQCSESIYHFECRFMTTNLKSLNMNPSLTWIPTSIENIYFRRHQMASLTVHNDTYRNEHSSCAHDLTARIDICIRWSVKCPFIFGLVPHSAVHNHFQQKHVCNKPRCFENSFISVLISWFLVVHINFDSKWILFDVCWTRRNGNWRNSSRFRWTSIWKRKSIWDIYCAPIQMNWMRFDSSEYTLYRILGRICHWLGFSIVSDRRRKHI